jgi:hypothetical protein
MRSDVVIRGGPGRSPADRLPQAHAHAAAPISPDEKDGGKLVERSARKHLALALRRFASRSITNDQFEYPLGRAVRASRDTGVQAIRWAAWMLYDDLHGHRLEGPCALGRVGRRHVARWIFLLKSDLEYEWPELPGSVQLLLLFPNILTFNLLGLALRRWRDRRGDADVWPFMRRSDFARAVSARPRPVGVERDIAADGAATERSV